MCCLFCWLWANFLCRVISEEGIQACSQKIAGRDIWEWTRLTFTCSKTTIETLEKDVRLCSKLTIKTPEDVILMFLILLLRTYFCVFISVCEQIFHILSILWSFECFDWKGYNSYSRCYCIVAIGVTFNLALVTFYVTDGNLALGSFLTGSTANLIDNLFQYKHIVVTATLLRLTCEFNAVHLLWTET